MCISWSGTKGFGVIEINQNKKIRKKRMFEMQHNVIEEQKWNHLC
jgi:hypothetical protein